MEYELAKQLKDAGFPQRWGNFQTVDGCVYDRLSKNRAHVPDLSELIAACGGGFGALLVGPGLLLWTARGNGIEVHGDTPESAVANLWLSLNKTRR